jgi:hypothetical protein
MTVQSPGLQLGTVSEFQLGSPGKKSHLDVASAESSILYGGRWRLPLSPGRDESGV